MENNRADEFMCLVDVQGSASNAEDEGLAGVYLVSVSTSRPVVLEHLAADEKHLITEAVLNEFHDHQGIEEIDDFSIRVLLENGIEIEEADEASATPSTFSVAAYYCGSVGLEDEPDVKRVVLAAREQTSPSVLAAGS